MRVYDTWLTADGQRTRLHGRGQRYQAIWTGLDDKQCSRAFRDSTEAAEYAAEMEQAVMNARGGGFSLRALVAALAGQQNHWTGEALAAELRRRIPPGHEETALTAALHALAFTLVTQHGGAWKWPGRTWGGRRRSSTTAERDARALGLHRQGLTYQQVADAIGGRGKSTAYSAVQRALADEARQHQATSEPSAA